MTRSIHRRAFLGRSALLGAAAAGLNRPGECAVAEPTVPQETSTPAKSQPDVILHRGGYPGWPWVTPARDGRLVCVFRDDGVHGFSPTGKVMWTVLLEHSLIALIAGVVGVLAVELFVVVLQKVQEMAGELLHVDALVAVAIVAITLGLTLLTVLIAAWRPTRVRPLAILNRNT